MTVVAPVCVFLETLELTEPPSTTQPTSIIRLHAMTAHTANLRNVLNLYETCIEFTLLTVVKLWTD